MEEQVRRTGTIIYAVLADDRHLGIFANRRLKKLSLKRRASLETALRERKALVAYDGKSALIGAFPDVADALPCAADFQRRMAAENQGGMQNSQVWFRIGMAMGEILVAKADITGEAVDDARLIAQASAAGDLCVSTEVRAANPDAGRYPIANEPNEAGSSNEGFAPSFRFMMEAPSAATFDNYDAPVPPKWGWQVAAPMLFMAVLIGLFTTYLLDR